MIVPDSSMTILCTVNMSLFGTPLLIGEDLRTVTKTFDRYVYMLRNFLQPKPIQPGDQVSLFQGNGDMAHTA